ncbi:MAG: hypothetical protein AAF253_00225 [Pseudomonadota bacterium]
MKNVKHLLGAIAAFAALGGSGVLAGAAQAEWVDLGGDLAPGNVDCLSWGEGRLDCFGRNDAGDVEHKWYDRAVGWGEWETLGGSGLDLRGRPECVSWGEQRLDCFFVGGPDGNRLVHLYYNGEGFDWRIAARGLASDADCVAQAPDRLDCFWVSEGERLRQYTYRADTSSSEQNVGGRRLVRKPDRGGPHLERTPECEALGNGRIDCVLHTYENDVRTLRYNGERWRVSSSARYAATGTPECVSWGDERMDCFSFDADVETLRHGWLSGREWRSETLGQPFKSAPECVSWSEGRLDCFAMSEDRNLAHIWYDNGWGNEVIPAPFGPGMFTHIDCVSWGEGRIDCFAVGEQGQLIQKWYGGNGWQPASEG